MAHSCFYASQRGRGALSTRWAETLHRQTCSKHKRTLLPRRASPRRQHNHSMNPLRGNAPHTCRLCDGYILHTSRLGGACRADILWVPGEGKLSPRSIATWRRYTPPKEHCFSGRVYESTLPGEHCSLGRVHLFRCLVHSPESPCVLPLTKSRASQSQDTELLLLFLML